MRRDSSKFLTHGFESFNSREYAFWSLLYKHSYFRGPKLMLGQSGTDSVSRQPGSDLNKSESRQELVFRTGFNGGYGRKRLTATGDGTSEDAATKDSENQKDNDKAKSGTWWLNLGRMDFQSSFLFWPEVPDELLDHKTEEEAKEDKAATETKPEEGKLVFFPNKYCRPKLYFALSCFFVRFRRVNF